MDFEGLKEQIKEITAVVNEVPEPYREKCFMLLMEKLLVEKNPQTETIPKSREKAPVMSPPAATDLAPRANGQRLMTPAPVKVFMKKTGVTEDLLASLVHVEDGEVFFIKEPITQAVASGQIEWSLLLAFKSAMLGKGFVVDVADVRAVCTEKGYYDQANFAANFKKGKNQTMFREVVTPQNSPVALSDDGIVALGKLIEKLCGNEA